MCIRDRSMHAKIETLRDAEIKLKKITIELESYKLKCQKYKNELKCFDEKFFEEIEDLKYKYSEAVKLNKHYENILVENKHRPNPKQNRHHTTKTKNRVKFAMDREPDVGNEGNLSNDFNGSILAEENKETFEEEQFNSLDLSDLINLNNKLDLNGGKSDDDADLDLDLCLNESIDIKYLIDQK